MVEKEDNKAIISLIGDELTLLGANPKLISIVKDWDIEAPKKEDIENLKVIISEKAEELHKRISIFETYR